MKGGGSGEASASADPGLLRWARDHQKSCAGAQSTPQKPWLKATGPSCPIPVGVAELPELSRFGRGLQQLGRRLPLAPLAEHFPNIGMRPEERDKTPFLLGASYAQSRDRSWQCPKAFLRIT